MLRGNGELAFEDKWPDMQPVVLKLIKQENVSRDEWTDLFWLVHNVCMWDESGGPTKVRKALHDDITTYITEAQQRVMAHEDDSALLRAYIGEWKKFFIQCEYLPMPFKHLELTVRQPHSQTTRGNDESLVRKLMLDTWNDNIFKTINTRLLDAAMKLIREERNGEAFDTHLVIGVRESYVNLCSDPEDRLKIYREHFEKAYLADTDKFYSAKAQEYLDDNGVQNYMMWADRELKEEEVRAHRYLETSRGSNSVQALNKCCVNALVKRFREPILMEFKCMVKNSETGKLYRMFSLLDRIEEGIDPMLDQLEEHIKITGNRDMMENKATIASDPEKYVEQLLRLFNVYSQLVSQAFKDDPRFLTSRDKAFQEIVRDTTIFKLELPSQRGKGPPKTSPESKCPELLAIYCDQLLRKSPVSKRLDSEEVEKKLKDVLLVLKYIGNKDVFMRYHQTHLTRRLILNTSADSEKEENMVEWLRDVGMPADYVNKLARMFQDMKVSEDLNQEFKDTAKNNQQFIADAVNIKILNSGAWSRSSERVPVSLPVELEDFIPQVEEFYKEKHNGRKLAWRHALSNGVIQFRVPGGVYDLEVTTFQMAILFCWNNRQEDRLTFEGLRLATELPDVELRKTLWGLVNSPKQRQQVMCCSLEMGKNTPKDIKEDTLFWINRSFELVKGKKVQKRGRVNLIGRLQLTTEKTREEDNESIVRLRILRVQEAIVKIMKMRKELTNAQLQTELVEILKNMFQPTKKMIKEQIEWLIDHNYMKRHEQNINRFVYLA